MSKVCALYHIVFCTKAREMTITNEYRTELYKVIFSIIKEKKCHLLRMGGVPNHVHMLLDLKPTMALSDLMKCIKSESSGFLQRDSRFPYFKGWGKEYFASSVSPSDKDSVINYINSQQTHHGFQEFSDELKNLCMRSYMEYDERDLR